MDEISLWYIKVKKRRKSEQKQSKIICFLIVIMLGFIYLQSLLFQVGIYFRQFVVIFIGNTLL